MISPTRHQTRTSWRTTYDILTLWEEVIKLVFANISDQAGGAEVLLNPNSGQRSFFATFTNDGV